LLHAPIMSNVHDILQSVFGFQQFRGVQQQVVDRVLAGQHTLAVMPTGSGKSLCYQLPAVLRQGTCIVLSPLIALMQDQMRAASAIGLRAATLTSADTNQAETIARFQAGELDLLYAAPERATGPEFVRLLRQQKIALFAIDEAHCVSEWGHDFRPDYRLLRPLLSDFPDVPRLALTATADAQTRHDILDQLGISSDGMIVAGFDRPNIRYAISPRQGTTRQIADLVAHTAGCGIVYAQTRHATEKLAAQLATSGRPVRAYHAGLEQDVRARNQHDFVSSENMVMVATIAFGMGIDKPDVRFVAHAGLPKSIEAYYQETGRAGRDGDPAVAHMFWGADDFARARQRLGEVEMSRRPGEQLRLNALAGLVETAGCRRAVLLQHFGEKPPTSCGNCDHCLKPPATMDATEIARKLLSAVYRTGETFGITHLEAVLTGQKTERILKSGHDRLSVFGIVTAPEAVHIKAAARALLLRGGLVSNEYGGLVFGDAARSILKGEMSVSLVVQDKQSDRRQSTQQKSTQQKSNNDNPEDNPLFEALRVCRRTLAAENNLPPYVIFHDSTLRDMATLRPNTLAALGQISGVGKRKLESYGPAFLSVIQRYATSLSIAPSNSLSSNGL
jgi:ATP-dependent DNA helicase RecQ